MCVHERHIHLTSFQPTSLQHFTLGSIPSLPPYTTTMLTALFTLALATTDNSTIECYDLWHRPLYRVNYTGNAAISVERNLAIAQYNFDTDYSFVHTGVHDPNVAVWLGRRTAYQGRYKDAIEIYSTSLGQNNAFPPLLRHRGHRYISVRQFPEADADLTEAGAAVSGQQDHYEWDGEPNAQNVPTSTFQSNVWYHAGLARLLLGDYASALAAFASAMKVATANYDQLVATTNWYWIALMFNGKTEEAAEALSSLPTSLSLLENSDYLSLCNMYKGVSGFTPENMLRTALNKGPLSYATIGYGVGNYYATQGNQTLATQTFASVLSAADGEWAAFGYIAAEAQLFRSGWVPPSQ